MIAEGPLVDGPEILVVGGMKCGSTTLHNALAEHPDIGMARDKELNFFVRERNWSRGSDWYCRQFDKGTRLRGETSPNYTKHPTYAGVPERIARLLPDVRLLYVLRDPTARTVSHYRHNLADGLESRPIEEALLVEPDRNHYLNCSRYAMQLDAYEEFFGDDRVHVLLLEDLSSDFSGTLRGAFEYLGVDPSPALTIEPRRLNPRSLRRKSPLRRWLGAQRGATRLRRATPAPLYDRFDRWTTSPLPPVELSEPARRTLRKLLVPDALRLQQRLGRELPWPTLEEATP